MKRTRLIVMNETRKHFRLVIWIGLVHCLLAFFIAPIGWEHLYSWDSPHWLRALWAGIFDLPLVIIFGFSMSFYAPALVFVLIPVNSILFSWLIVTPFSALLRFRLTGKRRELMLGSLHFGAALALLGVIGALYIPPNILSQREVTRKTLREIDAATLAVQATKNMAEKP